jgi:predicted RNA-binding Zn-ribbon protein involved in translation (DUF1610 family)
MSQSTETEQATLGEVPCPSCGESVRMRSTPFSNRDWCPSCNRVYGDFDPEFPPVVSHR